MSCSLVKDKGRIVSRLWTTKRARTRVYLYKNLEEQKEQSTSKRDENDVKIIKK